MKKIMFNDKYGLTDAVLKGNKTMTRRNTDLYKVGEVVAIAQSYWDVHHSETPIFGDSDAGVFNKMFVKAERMPHHIRILSKRQEHLQDISVEDCLREGVQMAGEPFNHLYARDAFAALIDKVSGKGTWESNPLVWVYEFELID